MAIFVKIFFRSFSTYMKVNKTDNLNFGTNIKVVSPRFYKFKTNDMFSNKNCKFIDYWEIKPCDEYIKNGLYAYRNNVESGFTNNIRSCTAGIISNKKEKASLFFHIFNSEKNLQDLEILKKFFKGNNAILVGSKENVPFSTEIFEELKNSAIKNNLPLTILQLLKKRLEANLAYDSHKDTLFMCVNDVLDKHQYVESMDELKEAFKTVNISDADNIKFLSRYEEEFLRFV